MIVLPLGLIRSQWVYGDYSLDPAGVQCATVCVGRSCVCKLEVKMYKVDELRDPVEGLDAGRWTLNDAARC
jgi:hypothetical protein